MPESLIDLGGMTNQAIHLAQLAQYQRMNDTRQARQEQDDRLTTVARRSELLKNPLIHGTSSELELISDNLKDLGLRPPPREELLASRESIRHASRITADPNATNDQKQDAWMGAFMHSPELTKQALSTLEQSANYDEKRYKTLLEMDRMSGQIREMNQKQNTIELRQNVYSTTGGILNRLADTINLKDPTNPSRTFAPVFQRLLATKDENAKKILLAPVKGLESAFRSQLLNYRDAVTDQFSSFQQEYGPLNEAVKQAQAEGKPVDPSDLAKIKALELTGQAQAVLNQWVEKPYDKQNWTRLQNMVQHVKAAASGTSKELSDLYSTRQGMLSNAIARTDLAVTTQQIAIATNRAQSLFGALPDKEQTSQSAAKIANDLHRETGLWVSVEEIRKASKEPNKPLVEVNTYDKKQNVAEAGKLANVNQAISELQQVRAVFVNPDGSINRKNLLTGALGVPFTEGRGADEFVRKAVEIKLRAATGAAARPDEIKLYAALFGPSVKDSDEVIKYKIDSFENWMQTVADTTDPEGSLRSRADLLMSKGTISLLQSSEYKELRQKFPQASSGDIVRFLQTRNAKEQAK